MCVVPTLGCKWASTISENVEVVLFTSGAGLEIYRQIGVVSAVMQMLYLTYILELWVVTESITLWIQVAEIQFLWRVPGFPLKNKVQTWVIWDSFRLDQKRYSWGGSNVWLGCLVDDSLNRCFHHIELGGDPKAQPGHPGDIISLGFPWKALDFPQRS